MTDIVSPPTIAPLPPAPLLTDTQADFNAKAFATVGALPGFVSEANALALATNANATAAQERSVLAQASSSAASTARDQAQAAANTAVNAPGTKGTSTSPLSVGAGYKSLATQAGKAWAVGQAVVLARTSAPLTTRMFGIIDGYDSGTGSMTIFVGAGQFSGSGNFSDWTVSLTATREGLVAQGTGPGQGSNALSLGWASPRIRMSVDGSDIGSIATGSEVQQAAPPGLIGYFATSGLPAGWLKANGALVSRTTYLALFSVIGDYYGAGDGTTTFQLPDLRGVFVRSLDDGKGFDPGRLLGASQGPDNQSHGHSIADAGHAHGIIDPSHAHPATTVPAGSHAHDSGWTRNADTGTGAAGQGIGGVSFLGEVAIAGYGNQRQTSTVANHQHTVSVSPVNTGISIVSSITGIGIQSSGSEARPRNVAMAVCIKY